MSFQTEMTRGTFAIIVQALGSEKAGLQKRKTQQNDFLSFRRTKPKARKKELPVKKDFKCFQANENICGFCLLNYYSEKSMKKSGWICCIVCKTWYPKLCVGAFRRKIFTYGRCV
jgi:hypothetical protein